MKDPFDVDTEDFVSGKKFPLEKEIQSKCVAKARAAGWWARKFSSAPGNTSVPDYVFAKARPHDPEGRTFYVEFKRLGGEPTERQQKEHMAMRVVGGLTVYVCDSVEEFDEILENEEDRVRRVR